MTSVTLPAFAKVNLHLDVLRKLPDGYHELLTLFERIDLSDELRVARRGGAGIELKCHHRQLPADSGNLAVRAVEEYRRSSGWKEGIRIELKKKIPIGGGLGGGSSDAAAALRALQQLSRGALPQEKLIACARRLGADVAFFLEEAPFGVGRGRGDEIEPLALPARFWHLLVTPDFPIPTKAVYQAFRPGAAARPVEPFVAALKRADLSSLRELLYNALEPAVEGLHPAIRDVKAVMEAAGAERPMVSGSGSTVFALCNSKDQADSAAAVLRKRHPHWRVFAVETI